MPHFVVAVPSTAPHEFSSSFLPPRQDTMSSTGFFGNLKSKLTRKNSNKPQGSKTHTSPRSSRASRQPSFSLRNDAPFHLDKSGEAPPPYSRNQPANAANTPHSVSLGVSLAPASDQISIHSSVSTDGDEFAFLRTFDTVFLIDDSGSMSGSRWRETANAIGLITPICTKYDQDGIDIYFLNHRKSFKNVKQEQDVREIFSEVRPRGGTPLVERLDGIIRPYLAKYQNASEDAKPKPLNVIVVTDGEVGNNDLEGAITQAARRLDAAYAPAYQLGIQFFQIGNDPRASQQLKDLDDELGSRSGNPHMRDIVDTVPYTTSNGGALTSSGILKVVLGAVNRRLDRQSRELHR
jgi:hypothetical protein